MYCWKNMYVSIWWHKKHLKRFFFNIQFHLYFYNLSVVKILKFCANQNIVSLSYMCLSVSTYVHMCDCMYITDRGLRAVMNVFLSVFEIRRPFSLFLSLPDFSTVEVNWESTTTTNGVGFATPPHPAPPPFSALQTSKKKQQRFFPNCEKKLQKYTHTHTHTQQP